ncbi:MAG: glycoside hydrolase family 6 protein, partial [Solirubrobacterales bacterium]
MTRATITITLLLGLALAPGADASGRGDPFEGAKLYVDPDSNAARQAAQWRAARPLDAMAMQRIASRPQADWFGDWNTDIRGEVGARVSEIAAAGALPVLVAYNIPSRDCGGHSAGGARSERAYLAWLRGFAAGIGDRPAAVVLEPDALAGIDCLRARARRARLGLLRRAVRVLEARSAASVYIDAGHSGWNPVGVTVRRLRK